MSNGQVSKGRLLQVKQGYKTDGVPNFENGEFGLVLDEGQEELYIGSNSGNIQVVTERNIVQLAVPDGSISRTELDGEVNTLLDKIGDVTNIPEVTTNTKGLMNSSDKVKLNGIEEEANKTIINNTLTSLSTTEALSAYQGKLLKDMIDNGGGAGGGGSVNVIDNLTSTDTTSALSANQGRVIKGLLDGKAGISTATQSSNGLMSANDKIILDNLANGGGGSVTVVNSLTSTDTSAALSAYQGKVLNDSKLSGYQYNNSVSGSSTALGIQNDITDDYSLANGFFNTISQRFSFTNGFVNGIASPASMASGNGLVANSFASMAIGYYGGTSSSSPTSYNASADAFAIGNGNEGSSVVSNAFRVTFDGKAYGRSAYNSSGADYAEYFEWLDGNVDNEDRVGYFVTLDGDKIRKANSSDTYILGIISANPSVVGDASSEGWVEEYVRDEFGRVQYHYVDVEREELNEEGEKITVVKNEYHPIYNPKYNPQTPYIPREDRKEWDAVGMMGKLLVRDDGTCKVNGYCLPNDDGIATKSDEGYRVMKRVSDNIIQVLVK